MVARAAFLTTRYGGYSRQDSRLSAGKAESALRPAQAVVSHSESPTHHDQTGKSRWI
jgi:hypothetical protein